MKSFDVIILERAQKNIADIIQQYSVLSPNAIARFEQELQNKKLQLSQFPESAQCFELSVRRLPFYSLPFNLYYRVREKQVQIITILPQKFGPQRLRFQHTIH